MPQHSPRHGRAGAACVCAAMTGFGVRPNFACAAPTTDGKHY
jgi:hypothetical protein